MTDLPIDSNFINACSGIVYNKPNNSRDLVDWSDNNKKSVQTIIDMWPILRRYSDIPD